jgi:CheY-like chemotaxis protein
MQTTRVMIIDDDSDDRGFLTSAFSKQLQPVQFTECNTAEQAIDHLRTVTEAYYPHVIFLDLHMPGKDGYQTLAEIKAYPPWAGIPIIIISSSMLKKEEDRCRDAGCSGFFTKPMSLYEYDQMAANTLRYLAGLP